MTYKNSIKIMYSNFSLCWKQLVWLVLSGLVVFALAGLVAMPIIDMLSKEGFFDLVKDFFEGIYVRPRKIPTSFADLIKRFGDLIKSHSNTLLDNYILLIVVIWLGVSVMRGLGLFACSGVLAAKMSSNAQIGYTNRLVSTLGKGLGYSLTHALITLPFLSAIIGLVVVYALLSKTILLAFVLLPVFSVLIYLIWSIKIVLFSCMIAEMINGITNPFVAFAKGVKLVSTRFWRTFSNAICVVLTISVVNFFVGVFTLGAGLLVTIPASSVFLAAFGMVTYYSACNKNFYISELIVVNLK